MFNKETIVVLGSINTDINIKGKRLPEPGETMYADDIFYTGGGKGANQIVAVSRLLNDETKTEMIGTIGDDLFGKRNLENLIKEGISIKGIRSIPNTPTGIAVIFLDEKSENYIILISGANQKCNSIEINYLKNILSKDSILLLQQEIPIKFVSEAITVAKQIGVLTILDPAPYVKNIPNDFYQYVDIITPNKIEAQRLTNVPIESLNDAFQAGEIIRSLGPKFVIITLGKLGAVLISNVETTHIKGIKVDAVNTVAAGDCFNGALAVGIKNGMSVTKAIEFGNKAASICVSRQGAQESLPYYSEIKNS